MENHVGRSTTLATCPDFYLRAFYRGWMDGQHTAAWTDDYERASRADQVAYESGRLVVLNVIASGLPVPIWRGDRAGVRAVGIAAMRSIDRTGNPLPPFAVARP